MCQDAGIPLGGSDADNPLSDKSLAALLGRVVMKSSHLRLLWPVLRGAYSREWMRRQYSQFLKLQEVHTPSQWERRESRNSHILFVRRDRPSRALLVCFPGSENRMLIPTAHFLESLRDVSTDMLLLNAGRGAKPQDALAGFGDSFESACAGLRGWIEERGYEEIATYGTSRGALAAILYGLKLGARQAVSIGPVQLDKLSTEHIQLLEKHGQKPDTMIRLVYGQRAPRDATTCFSLKDYLKYASVSVIPGAFHAPLWILSMRKHLGRFHNVVLRSTPLDSSETYPFLSTAPPTVHSVDAFIPAFSTR